MTKTLTIDRAGRIVVPKVLRDELNLGPGDQLELESQGGCLTLRPLRSSSPLRKEQDVWVFRGSKKLSGAATNEVLERSRSQRDQENRGIER